MDVFYASIEQGNAHPRVASGTRSQRLGFMNMRQLRKSKFQPGGKLANRNYQMKEIAGGGAGWVMLLYIEKAKL